MQAARKNIATNVALLLLTSLALGLLFWPALENMYFMWHEPEYNHGFIIPFVALYLLWLRARDLSGMTLSGAWLGTGLLLVSVGLLFVGDRSAVFALTQYAFVLALWSLTYAGGGRRAIALLWVPLLYLIFLVPLPDIVTQKLTATLQLLSSQIGVAVIRLAGVSVFLEGNVIDLGSFKLQVVEACSGMRYLFPLLSFGFLCAVLFRGRWWQRGVLLVSTVPITVLMNSFRIGAIGILVKWRGIEQAEGFLHQFEGWVIFMASVGLLFTEIWIFARMENRPFLEIFGFDLPPGKDALDLLASCRPNRTLYGALALLGAVTLVNAFLDGPKILIPERTPLQAFPMQVGAFEGNPGSMDQVYLDVLRVSDHLLSDYRRPEDPYPVGLWVAFYDSQSKGASTHSPQACLPGGGWRIESLTQRDIPGLGADGSGRAVNRVEIAMGDQRQLVYYWFAQRGRVVTNEFAVKGYILWDGLTKQRTDGALVRIATYVGQTSDLPAADTRLEAFMRAVDAPLDFYLPGEKAKLRVATPEDVARLEAPYVPPGS